MADTVQSKRPNFSAINLGGNGINAGTGQAASKSGSGSAKKLVIKNLRGKYKSFSPASLKAFNSMFLKVMTEQLSRQLLVHFRVVHCLSAGF